MAEPNSEIVPDVSFIPAMIPDGDGVAFVGRPTANGQPGARLTAGKTCGACGKPFVAGDHVKVRCAMDWDDAAFAHHGCPLPDPPMDPSTMRYRGWGMRNDSAPLPAKLAAFKHFNDHDPSP